MGKRGPKPVDLRSLNLWDGEFHKAFRSLQAGMNAQPFPRSGFTKQELRSYLGQLKRMTPEHYWLTARRLAVKRGVQQNIARPPLREDLEWAKQEMNDEIRWIERELNPPKPETQVRRRKVWDDLIKASSYAALRKVCGRWSRLPDVWRSGMTSFSSYVAQNAAGFLSMKRNKRFPRSAYGDNARIDYLARGMAGVLVGRSPQTGVERLRNMRHEPGGPLWVTRQGNYALPKNEHYCGCWRCTQKKWNDLTMLGQTRYENGLRAFMELAETTKVPKEWNIRRKQM
jgi:hypothetical protein